MENIEISSMKHLLLFIAVGWLATSCINDEYTVQGHVPIYAENNDLGTIQSVEARPLVNAGKLFYYQNYLFISENNEGIHIFDNSDPENIQNISFITLKGNRNVAVKGNYMYANNYADMVVLDISDPTNVEVVQRFENQIGNHSDYLPPIPEHVFKYLCPDGDKIVIGWEEGSFSSDECHKRN